MAMRRRGGDRLPSNMWPGYVDALTALLLVLMFVLSIFMIVQFVLRETVAGKDRSLNELTLQLSDLSDILALERNKTSDLEDDIAALSSSLGESTTENERLAILIASLTTERDTLVDNLNAAEEREVDLTTQIAALNAKNDETTAALKLATDNAAVVLTEKEQLDIALSNLKNELDAEREAAKLASVKRKALEALVEKMNAEAVERDKEIAAANVKISEYDQDLLLNAAAAKELNDKLDQEREAAKLAAAKRQALEALIEKLNKEAQENADEIADKDQKLAESSDKLSSATENLSEVEKTLLLEQEAAKALRERILSTESELTALELTFDEELKKAERTLTLLAAAEAAKKELSANLTVNADEIDQQAVLLSIAQSALEKEKKISTENAQKVELLNQQMRVLREQLGTLQLQLEASEKKDADAQVQITNLGTRLNAALARELSKKNKEAKELANYKSEFFGKVREVLKGRSGVKIVGDRFVFQSEVLFNTGAADLGAGGQLQLSAFAEILRDLARDIPDDINWVLRVDGHTDNTPIIGGARYANNWELSQARALSVALYLINTEGIPPNRLAPTGFGEFQPIDDGETPEALSRNRRIELKLTER